MLKLRLIVPLFLSLICGAGLLSPVTQAADELWQTDFAAACAKAKAENKLLLVDFTGSDWCPPCMRLAKEVFAGETFQKEAPQKFVLVELDYPAQKELPAELTAQNKQLKAQYKISAYPTVLILDPEGNRLARTGYRTGGDEVYIKHLHELVATHTQVTALQAKLEKTAGAERAKLLDEIITGMEKLRAENADIEPLSTEIVSLDPDNKAGLKLKYAFRNQLTEAASLLKQRKTDEALAAYDQALAMPGITPEQKQRAYFDQGGCYFSKGNFIGVVSNLEKALQAAPESDLVQNVESTLKRYAPTAEAQKKVQKLQSEAEQATGLDRAKLLDQLIKAQKNFGQLARIPESTQNRLIAKWAKEIVQLDADNEAGLKAKYEPADSKK